MSDSNIWIKSRFQPTHGRFVVWHNLKGNYEMCFWPNVNPNLISLEEVYKVHSKKRWY